MSSDSWNTVGDVEQQRSPTIRAAVSARVKFFTHEAKEILLVDFSHADVPMMKAVAEECRRVLAMRPHASVRALVNVEGARFDKDVIQIVGDLAKHNRPYVVRSAVLGVMGLRQIAFNAVVALADRQLKMFEAREVALAWLVG